MKYSEAAKLAKALSKSAKSAKYAFYTQPYIDGYEKGMEDIIRVLCDMGVIDTSPMNSKN